MRRDGGGPRPRLDLEKPHLCGEQRHVSLKWTEKQKRQIEKDEVPYTLISFVQCNKKNESTRKSPATADLMNNNGTWKHLKCHYLLVGSSSWRRFIFLRTSLADFFVLVVRPVAGVIV